MKFTFKLIVAIGVAAAAVVPPAYAQTSTTTVSVSGVRTGWNGDSFAITTYEPIYNPASCPTPDGYISDKSFPGYSTYYSAALSAITFHLRVVVTLDVTQCFAGRPKIIGVNLISNY